MCFRFAAKNYLKFQIFPGKKEKIFFSFFLLRFFFFFVFSLFVAFFCNVLISFSFYSFLVFGLEIEWGKNSK